MADRKRTPDIMGEILGGEPAVPAMAAVPQPAPKPRRRPPTREPSAPPKAKLPKWEYMEVIFRDYGGYRARYVNGQEQIGWKQAPIIYEYLNQLGEQGWEMVGVSSRHNEEMPAYFKRRKA
jgi:hypothetical protein